MICPKCQDLMRTISRGSVHIEQCENCHGVFLDGGELEQIIAAERAHYAPVAGSAPSDGAQPTPVGSPPPYQPPPGTQALPAPGAPPPYQPPPVAPPAYPAGYHDPYYPRRKRSFLEELLD